MPHNIVVARALPRDAASNARELARIDMGSPESGQVELPEYHLRETWLERLGRGAAVLYIASIAPPYQVVGYAELPSGSLDAEPIYHASVFFDEQMVIDALCEGIESRRQAAVIVAQYMHPEVPDYLP